MTLLKQRIDNRLFAVLVVIAGGLVAIIGAPDVCAQDPFNLGPPKPCMINPSLCGGGPPTSTTNTGPSPAVVERLAKQWQDEHRKLVDTPANREFAKRVYEAALLGIDHVLKAEGKTSALAVSQNPQGNPALMNVLRQAQGGQYFLAQTMIVDSMVDASAYINGEQRNEFWLVNNWDSDVGFVVDSMHFWNGSEIKYLEAQSNAPNAFGPRNKAAAKAVLAAYSASHPD